MDDGYRLERITPESLNEIERIGLKTPTKMYSS